MTWNGKEKALVPSEWNPDCVRHGEFKYDEVIG